MAYFAHEIPSCCVRQTRCNLRSVDDAEEHLPAVQKAAITSATHALLLYYETLAASSSRVWRHQFRDGLFRNDGSPIYRNVPVAMSALTFWSRVGAHIPFAATDAIEDCP
jgi:hypothetical protein